MSTQSPDSIHAGWRYPLYIVLVLLYACLMLIINASCLLSSLFPGREGRSPVVRRMVVAFSRLFRGVIRLTGVGRVRFEGFDAMPGGPCVIVANHTGMLDALMLLTILPDAAVVFKRGLRRSPFYSHLTTEPGYIGNDEGVALVRQGCRLLAQGRSLIIFPEGTRTEQVPVNRFQGGFAAVARRACVPVQTVLIENPSWVLGKGRGFFSRYALPFRYEYRLGERFLPRPDEDSHGLTARVEAYFQEALSHLQEPPWRATSYIPSP